MNAAPARARGAQRARRVHLGRVFADEGEAEDAWAVTRRRRARRRAPFSSTRRARAKRSAPPRSARWTPPPNVSSHSWNPRPRTPRRCALSGRRARRRRVRRDGTLRGGDLVARRVVHAFAPFAPQEGDDETGDDETGDVDPDGEMTLDAWDASVDAAASLADAVEEGECPGDENASERANLAAKMALAGDVARHVRAYWRAAAALEDEVEEDEDEDEEDEDAGSPRTDAGKLTSSAPAPAHAAHASVANLVRFACESIAEAVEKKTSVVAADAEAVWSAAGAWASYLPAWRLAGDAAADDAAFEAAAAMVASASAAGASASALAAMTAPTAAAAAAVIEESDDAVARRRRARARHRRRRSTGDGFRRRVRRRRREIVRRSRRRTTIRARAAHLLVAVAAASPAAFENDPAAWMRLREETAATAGWLATDADPGALLGAHVAAAKAALAAAVAPGADAPDKRRFGAILAEAMLGAAALLAPEDEGEDGDDGEDADDEDADDLRRRLRLRLDADSDDAFNETEAEMLERYAAIAREMAEGGSGGDDDDEGADGAGLAEEDEAFESALEPGHGDGKAAARAFVEWYAAWKKAGSSGMRVVSLVDPATVKTFHTRAGVA